MKKLYTIMLAIAAACFTLSCDTPGKEGDPGDDGDGGGKETEVQTMILSNPTRRQGTNLWDYYYRTLSNNSGMHTLYMANNGYIQPRHNNVDNEARIIDVGAVNKLSDIKFPESGWLSGTSAYKGHGYVARFNNRNSTAQFVRFRITEETADGFEIEYQFPIFTDKENKIDLQGGFAIMGSDIIPIKNDGTELDHNNAERAVLETELGVEFSRLQGFFLGSMMDFDALGEKTCGISYPEWEGSGWVNTGYFRLSFSSTDNTIILKDSASGKTITLTYSLNKITEFFPLVWDKAALDTLASLIDIYPLDEIIAGLAKHGITNYKVVTQVSREIF